MDPGLIRDATLGFLAVVGIVVTFLRNQHLGSRIKDNATRVLELEKQYAESQLKLRVVADNTQVQLGKYQETQEQVVKLQDEMKIREKREHQLALLLVAAQNKFIQAQTELHEANLKIVELQKIIESNKNQEGNHLMVLKFEKEKVERAEKELKERNNEVVELRVKVGSLEVRVNELNEKLKEFKENKNV